jgi:hypothetical protein
MPSRCCEFVDSRLCRSPPDRASAVTYGQAGENVMRFPHLAHRSAAAHKLHSTPQQHGMNLISGNGETKSRLPTFSLFLPGSCPNNRDRRTTIGTVRYFGNVVLEVRDAKLHSLHDPKVGGVLSVKVPAVAQLLAATCSTRPADSFGLQSLSR